MPHCTKCGAMVAEGTAFCGSCGAPQGAAAPAGAGAPAPAAGTTQTGLAENVAGALCYLLWWVTGLVFFLIDKRPSVRFHAAQSMVVFGGISILLFLLSTFSILTFSFRIAMMIHTLIWLAGVVLWVLLMVKAYQGERFRVPGAADFAEKIFKTA